MNKDEAVKIVQAIKDSPTGTKFNNVDMSYYDKARGFLEAVSKAQPLVKALEELRYHTRGCSDATERGVKNCTCHFREVDAALSAWKRDVLGEKP